MNPSQEPPLHFPAMCDSLLDVATVEQLFTDLAACTEILEVREKGQPCEHSDQQTIPLESARDRFLAGHCRAVQIRYLHDGYEWIDTLLQTPQGIRCVRVRVESEALSKGD